MILPYVKFIIVIFIYLLREIIIIKAETEEEATELWFSFLYDCGIYARTIEEYIAMAFELGFTEEQYTEQDKIDKGIWYPIPTGTEDGRTVSIKITIPEYNGTVELSEEVAEYLGKTDDGKIKGEVRQKIPLFRISSTDNKQYKRKGFIQMDKEQKKRSGGQPSIEKLVDATEEANAEALIRDWKNLIDSKTGKEIPFSMPMAARIMKSHPSISDRILEIAQDKNNYLVGAPSANIEALAEK